MCSLGEPEVSRGIEQNGNFKWAIIISSVLHSILFTALVWSSFDEHINVSIGNEKYSIDAVMVDLNKITQNYNGQQLRQENTKHAEEQHKKQAQKQQNHSEMVAVENKTKYETQKKTKEEATKKTTQKVEKKTTTKKKKAIKKTTSDTQKKTKEEDVSYVDDLLNDLSSNSNTSKANDEAKKNKAFLGGNGKIKNNVISDNDVRNYANQIRSEIENHFYNASFYTGKTCTLSIKLASDGMLLEIKPEGGDIILCNAAIAAARQAKIPKPPSQDVYEVFKNALLDFKP